jgi:hypothetical protein
LQTLAVAGTRETLMLLILAAAGVQLNQLPLLRGKQQISFGKCQIAAGESFLSEQFEDRNKGKRTQRN